MCSCDCEHCKLCMDKVKPMRYTLGPAVGPFDVAPVTPAPDGSLVDLTATLIGHDNVSVTLQFAAYDPAVSQPPAEIRLYLIPEGQASFATADEYTTSPYPTTTVPATVDVAGQNVVVAKPECPPGKYLGQIVFGYAA